jgi:protease-4
MTAAEVDAVARGKVWTGEQALVKRLVYKVGGFRQALAVLLIASGVTLII